MTYAAVLVVALCGVCILCVARLYVTFSEAFDDDPMPEYDVETEEEDGRF